MISINSIRGEIDRLHQECVSAWCEFVSRRFGVLSQRAKDDIVDIGGFRLDSVGSPVAAKLFPEIVSLLSEYRIISSGFTHGGFYFFADPQLYCYPVDWRIRRTEVDKRLGLSLHAIPRIIPFDELDYPSWILLLGFLDLMRTDLATVYWNELCLHQQGIGLADRVRKTHELLEWIIGLAVELLPPFLPCDKEQKKVPYALCGCPPATPPTLDGLPADLLPALTSELRSRREGDNLFFIWSSLSRLASQLSKGEPSPKRIVAFGNGFGALDLGFFVANVLRSMGFLNARASTCRFGAYHSVLIGEEIDITTDALESLVFWPEMTLQQGIDKVYFCDDSILTGGTFGRFCSKCTDRAGEVEGFFLTFDLDTMERRGLPQALIEENLVLACHATHLALWGRIAERAKNAPLRDAPPPTQPTIEQLIDYMCTSRDLQLRWIGVTQMAFIQLLNQKYSRVSLSL